MNLLNQILHNNSPIIAGFGLKLENDFTKVPVRRLDAPKLQYGNNKIVTPAKGVWRGENLEFLMPRNDVKWAILCTNHRTQRRELEEFAGMVRIFSYNRKKNSLF